MEQSGYLKMFARSHREAVIQALKITEPIPSWQRRHRSANHAGITMVRRRLFIPASERPTSQRPRARLFENPWHALGALSNFGLLLLAVAGYVLTVRPVYQKELLEEQTARMQKERLALTDQLSQLNAQVASAENSLAQERLQAAQYKQQVVTEENALRGRLALETDAYLRRTNDAKAQLAAVEAKAARWSADLQRRQILHKHQEAVAQRCVHDYASNAQPLDAMLVQCMAVSRDLQLSPEDHALLREWTDFYARNVATRLAVPSTSSLLYGWASLRRDFPDSEMCWNESMHPLSAEEEQRCATLKPMAVAITRSGDFGMALNEATRNIVAAVEAGATLESVRSHTAKPVPAAPSLLVVTESGRR